MEIALILSLLWLALCVCVVLLSAWLEQLDDVRYERDAPTRYFVRPGYVVPDRADRPVHMHDKALSADQSDGAFRGDLCAMSTSSSRGL